MDIIKIRGARQHNLKNIDLDIPRNKLVVVTGLSGSGKSSLAFDTIYAEGQRKYVESLSAYARQFLDLMEKPDADIIEGLSPAISIEQRNPSHNPRSTVGTVTEIYDYMRLLFARIGVPHCPECGKEIKPQSAQQIIDEIMKFPDNTLVQILSPLVKARTGTYEELFARLAKSGYTRVRVDKQIYSLEEKIKLDRYKKHTIDIVVGRIKISKDARLRVADSVETALKESKGLAIVTVSDKSGKTISENVYSEKYACSDCAVSLLEIEPRLFSFNTPFGACPECGGLGNKIEVDENLVVPNKERSVKQGAIIAWSEPITTKTNRWKGSWGGYYWELLSQAAKENKIPTNVPWKDLTRNQQTILLYGKDDFEGVITNIKRRYTETESDFVKEEIYNKYMGVNICPLCKGKRLKKEALSVLIKGKSIADITAMSIEKSQNFFAEINLGEKDKIISKTILKEIKERVKFLNNVGLGYLSLDRESGTLSGGEGQRIHLATQIGSGLTGVLYVLDEPSIGLHQRDNDKLLETLLRLRDLGNSLIVVEHDEDTMKVADHIIDLGPGAGVHGGHIIAEGSLKDVMNNKKSLTGRYLKGDIQIPLPKKRKQPSDKWLTIEGAKQFNLKNVDVHIPIGLFTCVTGVSGSGKSTLVHEIIYKNLANKIYGSKDLPGKFKSMDGVENIDKVVIVDQSPIGRTPRSNPATYTGSFGIIRDLFAQLPESKARGYLPGRFSFNVKGGRCENCQGDGTLKIEMQFLPDVYVKCDVCDGKRFNEETLQIRYKGKNISEILEMTVEEGVKFFENFSTLNRILKTLDDVGLGYIKIGQQATTLSGGEAQRVKLAAELSKKATGRTIYILDEPTTGLHFADVGKLLEVLQRLTYAGNSVIVIEHNLDVIKTADWIVDLGPEGGERGGKVVAEGSPEDIMKVKESFTGLYLKEHVRKHKL
ncbi:excinuclease ABC subunit UvrA [Endomicrobium proavitum]|uniref:UvrABC system protein A n=1 Tax=Endomicrobium proavitum TaxID=1408281 RepID=A0A0G3WHK9_9BACT|nr:excinuclease ABC subunit UvrA [Endomicrobium proavitum]AKL98126.1 ATPase and DNA damage recognition protein of nucleotide excision repair excinuclease UvrABC [Endomicrobium proavitum]